MSSRNLSSSSANQEPDLQDQLADFWQIVMRHFGLFLTTLVIACSLGAFYYLKAPRVFESQADLLIETKFAHRYRPDNDERRGPDKPIETHALMIQSHLVIDRAVKAANLEQLPSLVEEDDVINFIIENSTVSLKDENSTILNLRFRCSDPSDSEAVVTAIAQTYEEYLGESNQASDLATAKLIRQANEDLLKQLNENGEALKTFQESAPLMWDDGQAVNVHHERQIDIEAARKELMVQKTVLRAKVDSIEHALSGDSISREAISYLAINQLKPESQDRDLWWKMKVSEQQQRPEHDAAREYSSLLMSEYVRLMVQESELSDEFESGHPKLVSASRRKAKVRRMLDNVMTNRSPLLDEMADAQEQKTDYVEVYVQMLRDELAILDQQIKRLDKEFAAEQTLANKMHKYILRFQQLTSQREHTRKLFDVVVADLKEIDLIPEHGGDTAKTIAPPEIGEQVAPTIPYVGVASIFLGGLFGGILAWAVDRTENTYRSAAEIRQHLQVPIVGCIPHLRRRDQIASANAPGIAPIVTTLHQDKSNCAEAFRGVRTKLYFSAASQDYRVIQITSPLPGDGKSTVTANLAVAIAKSGKRVLVMDADFRRPSMTKLLGKPRNCQHGLAAVIAGKADPVDSALVTDVPNLFFLPALERPLNPSELLSTPQFKNLLDVVRERFDFVLIDTPPLLAVTDPCAVAARADGVLLALRIRKGVQDVSMRAMEMLRSVDANVLGTIVNGVEENSGFQGVSGKYGSYGYAERYTDREKNARRAAARETVIR